ncbi:MAG: leucine-rich repeat protein, partial [Clostridia bacterium]|nr:leucine-rich repeat protein [Clostridia bacterium]
KTEIDANGKLIITYDDETTVDLGVVVGAKGETGVGIQSVSLVDNNLTITLTNGTVYELGNVKGDKGDKGDQGDKGDTGAAGKSAYEIYKEKNPSYTGDETQWMSDLVNGKLATVEVVKHTVTFDSNGGTPVEPQQVQEGKKAIQPQNPTREGYTFLGWYGGLYGNEKWVFIGYPVTEPITLTAKWEINSYTLTFDSNDGSAVENDVVVYNTNYTLPQPTKDGFVFAGWLIDGILYEQETIVVKQDLELVAKWVNPTYTLSFNTGFDDVVLQPQTINYKQQYTLPQFQKDGYTFLGWCDENGNKIEEGIWKFDQDMTLTAQWRGLTDMFEFEKTTDGVVITKYVGNDADVVVPATITQQPVVAIDANAFANNVDITSVAFDGSFTNFSEKMFAGCTNLQKLTISSAWAGPLYTLFGDSIDSVPSSLVDIEYATNSVTINPTMWQSKVANHNVSLTLANDVATIPADQFSNCDGLTHVVVPQGVTRIGEYAFEYCSSLTSVVISSSVTSIGEYIFHACYDLTICCLSTSKPRGWHRYWDGTNNGSNVIIYWGIIEFVIDSQGINYLINNTDVKVLQYNGSQVEIVIPDKIEGYAVTKIDENVFKNNTTITSITIPASVKNIGDGAFYKCNNLAKVTFGETSQLETIGASAFYGCDSLINIVIPSSVTSIGTAAFHDCSNLNIHMKNLSAWCNISFGGSLSNPLDNSVDLYFNNTKVTGLVIPNDVTEIKAYAFYNFDSITSVTIPNSVTSIGSNAFANCDSLDSVYI